MPVLSEQRMRQLVGETLVAAGLSRTEADACADTSVFADLRGVSTHGCVYIIPQTLTSLAQRKTISGSAPEIVKQSSAATFMKGAGAPGPVLGRAAMQAAVDMARMQGIGVVNVFNGNPLGMLGYYANLAAEAGLIGMVMANTAPAAAPYGATSAVLGTNPFAYAIPARTSRPMVFDVATTVASSGKLARLQRQGLAIPIGWLIGADGEPVTSGGVEAALLPCGGHKGSGFAILIHLLTGALSGTTVGGEQTHNNSDPARRGQAALYLAIDPDWFGSRAVFEDMAERQIEFIHDARPIPGEPRPLYPGERGWAEHERRQKEGIAVADADWAMIEKAVAAAGLPGEQLFRGITRELA